jgi:hypothetical protein
MIDSLVLLFIVLIFLYLLSTPTGQLNISLRVTKGHVTQPVTPTSPTTEEQIRSRVEQNLDPLHQTPRRRQNNPWRHRET